MSDWLMSEQVVQLLTWIAGILGAGFAAFVAFAARIVWRAGRAEYKLDQVVSAVREHRVENNTDHGEIRSDLTVLRDRVGQLEGKCAAHGQRIQREHG